MIHTRFCHSFMYIKMITSSEYGMSSYRVPSIRRPHANLSLSLSQSLTLFLLHRARSLHRHLADFALNLCNTSLKRAHPAFRVITLEHTSAAATQRSLFSQHLYTLVHFISTSLSLSLSLFVSRQCRRGARDTPFILSPASRAVRSS